jgi:hypothetical protein
MQTLDSSEVRTVVDISAHMAGLREAAIGVQQTVATRQRGYFTPSEDEQVQHLWVSYHLSRAALLELIRSIRCRAGQASEETAGEFAVAYGAALVLVNAARTLRDLFRDNPLVRGKLNESYWLFGIEAGSFDSIQMSLTSPANALALREANEFYDEYREQLRELAQQDEGLRQVLAVIQSHAEATRVSAASYVKARARERGRDARDRILMGNIARAIYAIQEWGSRLVSNLSTMPHHVPRLPDEIAGQLCAAMRAGDVFVTRKECAVTNYFLPGYWPHAALFIGQGQVIESLKDGVRQRTLESPLGNDAVAVIRPQLEPGIIEQAIARAKTHVGKPYDFDFDFTRSDRLVCTEVVYRSYEGLAGIHFPLTRRAGRQTLSAEDLLQLALCRQVFEPVAVYCPLVSGQLLVGEAVTEALRRTIKSRQ